MATPIFKPLNNEKLDIASGILRAMAHPLRIKIMSFIGENKQINVNKIYKSLRMEQSIASQHLRVLRDAEVVIAERKGKFIYYSLNARKIEQVAKAVKIFLE